MAVEDQVVDECVLREVANVVSALSGEAPSFRVDGGQRVILSRAFFQGSPSNACQQRRHPALEEDVAVEAVVAPCCFRRMFANVVVIHARRVNYRATGAAVP